MLVPAIYKEEELRRLFAKHLYDKDMFYYNGYPYCNTIPDLIPSEGVYKWAIVDQQNGDKVVGYLTYYVNNWCRSVQSFGLYSFERDNPIIGIDTYKKMKELIKNYHRIEWRMIGDNPVEKHYDNIIKRYKGYKVKLHDVVKDEEGNYHDEYIYEIVKSQS